MRNALRNDIQNSVRVCSKNHLPYQNGLKRQTATKITKTKTRKTNPKKRLTKLKRNGKKKPMKPLKPMKPGKPLII